MILVRGWCYDTGLTGTIYEPEDEPPKYSGSPSMNAPYVWVCDSFYGVESGGRIQEIDGNKHNVVFEKPTLRGYETKSKAVESAKDHIKTQFTRLGVENFDITYELIDPIEED